MQIRRVFILFCWMAATAFAQTPPVAQSGGATLAETMAFLNEKLQQRGALLFLEDYWSKGTVASEEFRGDGCEQTYRAVVDHSSGTLFRLPERSINLFVLRLDQADVSSVAILDPDTAASGGDSHKLTAFRVAVNKIAYASQVGFRPAPLVDFELYADRDWASAGQVQSVDAKSLTWLQDDSGYTRRLVPDKSVTFHLQDGGGNDRRVRLADVSVGDNVIASRLHAGASYVTNVYIKKVPGAVAPVRPDPDVILPATRQVGPERKQFVFGYTKDREDAERMAKAMVHAIVLCQAGAKKDLF